MNTPLSSFPASSASKADAFYPRGPMVLEINPRVRLTALKQQQARSRVTLADFPEEEIRLWAARGFQYIWPLGVWTISPLSREQGRELPSLREEYRRVLPDVSEKDICGSPFSIWNYEPAPELGGAEALAEFRRRLKKAGLGLILDFVPNHLASDHPWTEERPELFIRGREKDLRARDGAFFRTSAGEILAHGRDPYFPPWCDTAQLDYGNLETHEAMAAELAKVAAMCDGVRCDMAMLLLPEVRKRMWSWRAAESAGDTCFWRTVLPKLKAAYPDFLSMAEVYWGLEGELLSRGFDFVYDKALYDLLRAGNGPGVRGHLSNGESFLSRCVHFVENHDEPRAAEAFGKELLPAAAAVSLCAPGMKLFHDGQAEGRRAKLPVQISRAPEEPPNKETFAFHEQLWAFLRRPLFYNGRWRLWEVQPAGPTDFTYQTVVAQAWLPSAEAPAATENRRLAGLLIVANIGHKHSYARLPFPKEPFSKGKWRFLDCAADEEYVRNGQELVEPGLFVSLEKGRAHLFEVTSEPQKQPERKNDHV